MSNQKRQWWVKGDCAESCTPVGDDLDVLEDGLTVVYAEDAEEASHAGCSGYEYLAVTTTPFSGRRR